MNPESINPELVVNLESMNPESMHPESMNPELVVNAESMNPAES
jgi:hypothetical protein